MDAMLNEAAGGPFDESIYLADVKDLLKRGANPNYVDLTGRTPLINAVSRDHIQIAKTLIASGADVTYGRLLYKCRTAKCMEVLLAAGADPNTEDIYGTPILLSIVTYSEGKYAQGENDILQYLPRIKILLQYGAVPHAFYMTNLVLLPKHPSSLEDPYYILGPQALQLLVDAGANIDEIDGNGRSGLENALYQYRFIADDSEKGRYPKWLPLLKTYIDNGATLDFAWIEGLFHPDDEAQILADAAFARRKHLIILREYLKSIGDVPGSSKGSKFFP